MYIVKIKNDNQSFEIHGENQKLKNGNVVKGINVIDSFSFALLPSNNGFNRIRDYKTLISVYNTNKNRYEFHGRVLYSRGAMADNGLLTKEVTCESYLGFLCDSKQRYVAEQNWTVLGLLTHVLDVHNSQVEPYKRFEIGEVTVTDPNDNLYLGIQRNNTWKTIEEKLIKKLGGEIRFRVVDDVIYLDYLEKIGETRTTEIKLSKNMKAITKECDPSAYISRLIPLGAKIAEDSEERLDITSVNNGVEYIEDTEALEAYGIRVEHVEFNDVTTASNLLRKGREYLAENNRVQVKYSIKALDLSLLGLDIDDFEVHNYHPIQNKLLGIDDVARINKKNINVCNDTESTIEVGDNFKTLSDLKIEQDEKIQSTTNELKEQITNTNKEVVGVKNTVLEQSTTIVNTCEEVVISALQVYSETGDFGAFKETVEAQLKFLAEEMTIKFTEANEEIVKVNNDLQSKYNTITKYFTFDINGLTIGQVDNPYKVIIDNDRYSMTVNGVEVMWIANGEIHTPEIAIERKINLFGYVIDEDEYGNVNCEYVGGQVEEEVVYNGIPLATSDGKLLKTSDGLQLTSKR